MKKLFAEPDIEILKFLCNVGNDASPNPDQGIVGGGDGYVDGDNDILP